MIEFIIGFVSSFRVWSEGRGWGGVRVGVNIGWRRAVGLVADTLFSGHLLNHGLIDRINHLSRLHGRLSNRNQGNIPIQALNPTAFIIR
jgi:hypothetical protein